MPLPSQGNSICCLVKSVRYSGRMNAQTKIVADMTVDQAHVFRSKLLDSFSEAERAVITLVALMPKKPSDGACLKQQIDHAKGIQPSPKLSKEKRDKVLNSLDRLAVP